MLDINKVESTNMITIVGTLNELEIEKKTTADGRDYIQGKASVRVEQEIGGEPKQCIVPVRMFSMKLKKDGNPNAVYAGIERMENDFTSLAAAEEPSQASRVIISGAKIQENMWLDKSTKQPRFGFQISSNFMKKARPEEKDDSAKFELSGVIGRIMRETDRDGEETGRLLVSLIVIGYNGKADKIDLIAQNPVAVNHIENKWNEGDTVSLAGIVNMTYTTRTWTEEQGFGEPIVRHKTESKRELLITSGSPSGLDEELSYDADQIKLALDDRKKRIAKLSENNKPAPAAKSTSFGF